MNRDEDLTASDSIDLTDYLRIVRERKWVVVASVVMVVATALLVSFLTTPQYRATAQLLYESSNLDAAFLGTPLYRTAQQGREVQTGAELVKLEVVAEEVKRDLGTSRSPGALLSMVGVQPQAQTDVVKITATSTDPAEAAAVANSFASTFVTARQQQARSALIEAQSVATAAFKELTPAQQQSELGAGLRDKIAQLQILDKLQTGGFRVVQPATVPTAAFSPQPLRNGVLALAVGLVLGIGLAFLLDFLDRRLKDEEAMEKAFGLPVLASVPLVDGKWRPSHDDRATASVVFPASRSALLEPFRVLRTNLQYVDLDERLRSILVTSALANEGKTVTAINLAFSLSLSGKRVILLDADLRKPRVHDYLSLQNDVGVSSLLAGTHSLAESVHLIDTRGLVPSHNGNGSQPRPAGLQKNLGVITSGPIPPNPAELLASARMEDLLAKALVEADYVIVDSAPLLLVSDALGLANHVDGVILTARMGHTTSSEAAEVQQLLDRIGAKCIGVVAGGAKPQNSYYHQGYYGHKAPGGA